MYPLEPEDTWSCPINLPVFPRICPSSQMDLMWRPPMCLTLGLFIVQMEHISTLQLITLHVRSYQDLNWTKTRIWSPGGENPLEKEMATHSSILAWKIPWEEPGRLQSMGSQRVGRDWATWLDFTSFRSAFLDKLPWWLDKLQFGERNIAHIH